MQNNFPVALTLSIAALSFTTLVEVFAVPRGVLQPACYAQIALLAVFLLACGAVLADMVLLLIHRAARLREMLVLYASAVLTFGTIYALIEVAIPGSFKGLDPLGYTGVLRVYQIFIDTFYFSNVCQASVGFGDVSPQHGFGRVFVVVQSATSMGFLSVMFSNWIS